MTVRKYSSVSQQTTLSNNITSTATSIPVVSATTLLGGITLAANEAFTVVIDPDTSLEEIVDVVWSGGNPVSSNNLTVTRGIDGSTGQSHGSGAVVRHMIIGRDLRDANKHTEASSSYTDGNGDVHTLHGLVATSGVVVGTTATQTLTNKTLVSPILTGTTENDSSIAFQGATVDAYATTLTVVDPTANNTITLPNTSGTVTLTTSAQTLSNKTLGSDLAAGGFKVTGLGTPTAANDAVTKTYADTNLAAAATSAASAATSASSAATSATAAATSAASAATSASAAATSASTALTSAATATTQAATALTSANSASTSASSSLTSANSAATSAASAAASVVAALYTAVGDILQGTGAGTAAKITIASTSGWYLTSNGTTAAWAAPTEVSKSLYSATGSILVASAASTPANLAIATTSGYVLTSNGTTAVWQAATVGYTAPTLGSTTLTSGATITTVAGLTLTTPVIGAATGTSLALSGDLTSTNAGAFSSLKDFQTLSFMGAI